MSVDTRKRISLVIPVLNESGALDALLKRIVPVADAENNYEWEFIFVDDGSTDDTADRLAEAAKKDERVRLLQLTRNFGQQVAITAGIGESSGDAVISMDGDLQHPPEILPRFLRKWEAGSPIVVGMRDASGVGFIKALPRKAFYWLVNHFTDATLLPNVADFRLMDRVVVDHFLDMPERAKFIRGMVSWMGYPPAVVEYREPCRTAGESKYSFARMVCLAVDAITSFSAVPLRIASIIGLLTTMVAIVYAMYVLFVWIAVPDIVVPGWASTVLVVLFLGGIQLVFLGVIGEYLLRVYDEVKRRPLYLVKRRVNLESPGSVESPRTL